MTPQNRLRQNVFLVIALFLTITFIVACNEKENQIPFPENESGNIYVAAEPFNFSGAKPISWDTLSQDSLKKIRRITSFKYPDLLKGRLASSKYNPMPAPIDEMDLTWDTVIHFDPTKLHVDTLKLTYSVLGVPRRTEAKAPRSKDGAMDNILLFQDEQGLSEQDVKQIIHDREGNTWIATHHAVCMFDGNYAYTYTTQQGLHVKSPVWIAEDDKGRIWVVGFAFEGGGVDIIDRSKGVVEHLQDVYSGQVQSDKKGTVCLTGGKLRIINTGNNTEITISKDYGLFPTAWIPLISKPENGIIWGIEGEFAFKMDTKHGLLKRFHLTRFFDRKAGWSSMSIDKNNTVWFASSNTNLIGGISEAKHKVYKLGEKQGLLEGSVQELAFAKDGDMIAATYGGGLYFIDLPGNSIRRMSLENGIPSKYLQCVSEDANGYLWTGSSRDGIAIVDRQNFQVQCFGSEQQLGNNNQRIDFITEDVNHNKWMGIEQVGVNKIDNAGNIYHFGQEQGLQTLTNLGTVFADSRGRTWVGTDMGLSIINSSGHTLENVFAIQNWSFPPYIRDLTEDKQGTIYVARDDGVFGISPDVKNIRKTRFPMSYEWNKFWVIRAVGNLLWLGTDDGFYIINTIKNTYSKIQGKGLEHLYTNSYYFDAAGRLWISTGGDGLYIMNLKSHSFQHLTTAQGLPTNEVQSVIERDGAYFVATSRGLCILKSIQTTNGEALWTNFNANNTTGFSRPDFTFAVLKDYTNKLWWGTGSNLTSLGSLKPDTSAPITAIAGIAIKQHAEQFLNGQLLLKILPKVDSIKLPDSDSLIAVSNYKDSGYFSANHITWSGITGPNALPVNLSLPFNQNDITFYFSSLPVSGWQGRQYRYILEGNDKHWSESSNKPEARYQNLKPGEYHFIVKSKGLNGRWSGAAEFSFQVTPPWWKTWWAYCLYVILVGTGVFMYVQYRSQALRKENVFLEKKVEHRTRQLQESIESLKSTQTQLIHSEKMASLGELTAGIAHEIQNPLNFVNNFSDLNRELILELKEELKAGNHEDVEAIASDIETNEEKISHHGKRAQSIVTGMLQHSRSGKGEKQLTDINKLADEYLRLAYHGMRSKDKSFECAIETSFDESIGQINIIPQEIGRVILNLVNNAFYAVNEKAKANSDDYKPLVTVTTKKESNNILLSVSDNGNGIPDKIKDKIFNPFFTTKPTGSGTGLGLSLSYDIVKAHGGEIKITSKEGEGSEFSIVLPA